MMRAHGAAVRALLVCTLGVAFGACSPHHSAEIAGGKSPAPGPVNFFDCAKLDYGIYWYGAGNVGQKAALGAANPFFDPSKPTLLYAHGWNADSYKTGQREDFSFLNPDNQEVMDLAAPWLAAGWNVGIFYWSQFGDEADVADAENKIWSATDTKAMRWRRCDGGYNGFDNPNHQSQSVGDLYFQAYREAMAGYQGARIRLVGHSLGTQLTMHLAEMISQAVAAGSLPANLLPQRVAQLDPWWSTETGTHAWPGKRVTAIAKTLITKGVALEMYRTSDILAAAKGDMNQELTDLIGLSIQIPGYITLPNRGEEIGWRHVAAPKLYFQSFATPPPPGCGAGLSCSDVARSAATSDELTKAMQRQAVQWLQVDGQATATTADDRFSRQ